MIQRVRPQRLRSLTLDGTYPLPGTDPAGADLIAAARRGLEFTCERGPSCAPEARADPCGFLSHETSWRPQACGLHASP